eukprot:1770537-Pleurochrysis_carterae.AAC.1
MGVQVELAAKAALQRTIPHAQAQTELSLVDLSTNPKPLAQSVDVTRAADDIARDLERYEPFTQVEKGETCMQH